MTTQDQASIFSKKIILISTIAAILIVIANSAIWINRQVFDTENFTSTAVGAVTSESSRQAISSRITDEALRDAPVLKNVAGDRIANLVSGLLATDQSQRLLTAAVARLQVYVTSQNQQDVDIDLSTLRTTLAQLIEISGNEETARINPENIPEKIVLIEEENVPDLYSFGATLNWIAVLGVLFAAVMIVLSYTTTSNRNSYLPILALQGGLVALVGLISLLLGPLFRPYALEPFRTVNGRVVASDLYDAFISTFNSQTMILIWVGLIILVVALGIKAIPYLRRLRG